MFDYIFKRLDTIHQRDGRTDGQMDTGRQQRPRLRIASRGKNYRALDSAIGVGVVMDPAKSLP